MGMRSILISPDMGHCVLAVAKSPLDTPLLTNLPPLTPLSGVLGGEDLSVKGC